MTAVYLGTLIDSDDLQSRLSPKAMLQLFNDDNSRDLTSDANKAAITAVIQDAEAQVFSYLARAFSSLDWDPTNKTLIPAALQRQLPLLKRAALYYAVGYSYWRHPEYVRTFGEQSKGHPMIKLGDEMMERICTGQQMVPELTTQPKTSTNGGIVYESGPKMLIDSLDGTRNGGDF